MRISQESVQIMMSLVQSLRDERTSDPRELRFIEEATKFLHELNVHTPPEWGENGLDGLI